LKAILDLKPAGAWENAKPLKKEMDESPHGYRSRNQNMTP